jgi:hypothetical protein
MTDIPTEVRTTVLNVDNGKGIYLQYEPEVITGNVSAVYNSDPALAGTHENLMFSHTGNENFTLVMRWNRIHLTALTGKSTDEASKIIDSARAFVRSLLNPVQLIIDVVGGEPPLLIVNVPGVINVYARLHSINWTVRKRDPATGQTMELEMGCAFREDPQYRFTSDDIADVGYERV